MTRAARALSGGTVIEKPIIFSAPMVKAILAGKKTQTRRLVKFPPWVDPGSFAESVNMGQCHGGWVDEDAHRRFSLRWDPGDRLWVKETFVSGTFNGGDREWVRYRATDDADIPEGTRWRPSIFMPRRLSRITLDVQAVRVECLQDIDALDAVAEGCEGATTHGKLNGVPGEYVVGDPREQFAALWDSINLSRAPWANNPWVVALTFRRVEVA